VKVWKYHESRGRGQNFIPFLAEDDSLINDSRVDKAALFSAIASQSPKKALPSVYVRLTPHKSLASRNQSSKKQLTLPWHFEMSRFLQSA